MCKPELFSKAQICFKNKFKFSYFYGYFYKFWQIIAIKRGKFRKKLGFMMSSFKIWDRFSRSPEKYFWKSGHPISYRNALYRDVVQSLKERLDIWYTVKLVKIWTAGKFAVITLKFEQGCFTVEASKRCRGNCKQCRPWSDCSSGSSLIRVCTVCPVLSVRKLRIITVKCF